ncbi:DUF937 domain-containing protein [Sphingomonas sp. SUN039]|uniref:DUF937 domain-containing protein n=1 Tax=Sphingomonas sp. SUN039 TaxID=2937787 RepID=UPI002164B65D|nr:DUF937 domain-containing protein [Sphingomonas sp. SUN039]UVO53317.1 DUF937 domain-containing protein [Sphingomonas sp. SUN039]
MNIGDIIAQSGGIGSIARELGIDEGTAQAGVTALLPAVLGGFKGQAQAQPEGLGGLLNVVQGLGGGGLLDSVLGAGPSNVDAGNNVLGQIFGSKDTSRAVAADASAKSGVSGDLLKKMLPLVAMLVAGYMAKQAGGGQEGGGGMLGSVLGSVLGGGQQGAGGLGGILGSVLGGGQQQAAAPAGGLGGLASMLDMDGDGNPLDDIMGMAAKFAR